MKYYSGETVDLGDHVVEAGSKGVVVVLVEASRALPPYKASEWDYLCRGCIIHFESSGDLVHYESTSNEEDLELVKRV